MNSKSNYFSDYVLEYLCIFKCYVCNKLFNNKLHLKALNICLSILIRFWLRRHVKSAVTDELFCYTRHIKV